MLARKNLVPLKKEFSRIKATAKSYSSNSFGLLVSYRPSRVNDPLSSPSSEARCAFIISKKVSPKSVVRHQVKRKFADLVQFFLPRLPRNLELVFLVKKEAIDLSHEEIKKEMEQLFRRIRLVAD